MESCLKDYIPNFKEVLNEENLYLIIAVTETYFFFLICNSMYEEITKGREKKPPWGSQRARNNLCSQQPE